MVTFSVKIKIESPIRKIWEVLADIGNIYVWNPGVIKSHRINDRNGIGSSRYCYLGGKNYLKEDVVEFEKMKKITFSITKTNLPFKRAIIRFILRRDKDGTIVIVSPVYELKYGILGNVLDLFFVRKAYKKGMENLLKGLKKHAES